MLRSTKPPKCPHCKRRLENSRQRLHEECQEAWIARQIAKQQQARTRVRLSKEKQERAQTKERKAALDTIPELIRAADRAFAAFIRERDRQAGFPCISSGKPLDWSGNKVDAGHYRSRGAASHLRYNEDNCHAQTKQENRYKAGNAVDYRVNLLVRIGVERVEALEADNEPHKWTREELRAIRANYAAKARELKETA